MARLFRAIRRDLEWLLSTRLTWVDDELLACEHASRSVAAFGLSDFSHETAADADARHRLKRAIEDAIARFEPRLTRVARHARAARSRTSARCASASTPCCASTRCASP